MDAAPDSTDVNECDRVPMKFYIWIRKFESHIIFTCQKVPLIFFLYYLKMSKSFLPLWAVQKPMMGQIWAPRLAVRWHKMLLSKCYLLCLKTMLEGKRHDIVDLCNTHRHTHTHSRICAYSHGKLFWNCWRGCDYRLLLWPIGTIQWKTRSHFKKCSAKKGKNRWHSDVS